MSLQKGFFRVQSSNPNLPPEEWTEFYINTTAGAYQTSLPWGKYKIVISGGGGGGAACGWNTPHGTRYAENGYNGEEQTIYVNVYINDVLGISGTVGAGGEGGYARTERENINHGGYGGTGYQNGADGSNQLTTTPQLPNPYTENASASGGGGGGSTSIEWNSTVQEVAAGGNGGTARQSYYSIWGYGGTGASGGTTTGTGASGGAGASSLTNNQLIGGTGTNGYIKIYQSNLKPEPL
ncbi:MAG: hypothetical protein J6U92_03025 [Clostridia bacterium]|nr:hypothetical protein [Clostridia bacterium]